MPKSPKTHVQVNAELANMVSELADFEKNVTKQIYKYNAYNKAAKSIMQYPTKITSGKEALSLEGVGKKIALKIDEYIKNGKINKLEKERKDEKYSAIKELIRVTGIGPVGAKKFIDEGISSIEDLRANIDKLNHHQQIGLKYLEDFESKILREEMLFLRDLMFKEIHLIDPEFIATICGSFRRGADSSGDIDLLLTHPSYYSANFKPEESHKWQKSSPKPLIEKVVNKLVELNFITDTLAFGDSKYMGVCQLTSNHLHRRLDIRLLPCDEYYCGLLYFTGSDSFNKNMRQIALKKGYTLNEYSLRKVTGGKPGQPLEITCERDIFDYLGMDFKEPSERSI